jgi:hypothetical protein
VCQTVNVDSLPQSSYPLSPPKDRDSTLTGLHQAPCEPIALMLNLSTTSASLEQSLVKPIAEFSLLQDDYKIVPCDKEKLCDHASLICTTQLVHEHDTSILDDRHEVRRVYCIDSEKEELKIISSLNCLGYIKFDFVCDLNSLENELFQKSGLLYLDYCTFHAIGLYDNNNSYIVQKVYICSDLTTTFMVPLSDKKVTCIEANNTISSFSPVDCRSIFKKGSLACCNVLRWTFQTCVQIDLRKHYFQTLTMMQNQGWFAAKKGRRG